MYTAHVLLFFCFFIYFFFIYTTCTLHMYFFFFVFFIFFFIYTTLCNDTPPMYTGNKQSDTEIILQFIWKRGKKGARQPTNQPTDRRQPQHRPAVVATI